MAELNGITTSTAAAQALISGFVGLFSDEPGKDFKIVCSGREWRIHRIVLQLHSKMLGTACNGVFKEAKENKLDLSCEHSSCVEAMVHYFYHLNYDCSLVPEVTNPLAFHVCMSILADKYDIQPLYRLAIDKFQHSIKSDFDEAQLAEAATCAYEAMGPTTEIRESIVKLAIKHKLFINIQGTNERDNFEQSVRACPDLIVDIVKALLNGRAVESRSKRDGDENRFMCPRCMQTFIAEIPNLTGGEAYWCCFCAKTLGARRWRQNMIA